MTKSPRRNLYLALGGVLGLCCLAAAAVAIWLSLPDSPADVARHATQTAQAGLNGAAQAAANATATAAFAQIDSRLQAAQPVFTDTLAADSAFLKQNDNGLSVSAQPDGAQIDLPFNAFHVWAIGQDLSDFVAQVDCQPVGSGAFCGLAYGDHPASGRDKFYASFYGAGGQCGFEDDTGGATSTKASGCAPPAPASGALNRLRVEVFGANLRFFVNGQLTDQRVLDNAAALSGGVGLYFGRASEGSSGSAYVTLANFDVAQLP